MGTAVCNSADIPKGSSKAVSVNDTNMLIFHLSDGFYATQKLCTHLFWPLTNGKVLDDGCVQCPFHHAQFDIRSGEAKQWASRPPGIGALNGLRPEKSLQTWPVEERDGQLFIEV